MPMFTNPTEAFGYTHATDGNLNYITTGTFEAAEAITRGAILELVADGLTVGLADNDSDYVVGVAISDAAAGQAVEVCIEGPCLVQASGSSVAANTAFSSGASGQVAAVGTAAGDWVVGVTRVATGTDAGALKLCYVRPQIVDTAS